MARAQAEAVGGADLPAPAQVVSAAYVFWNQCVHAANAAAAPADPSGEERLVRLRQLAW